MQGSLGEWSQTQTPFFVCCTQELWWSQLLSVYGDTPAHGSQNKQTGTTLSSPSWDKGNVQAGLCQAVVMTINLVISKSWCCSRLSALILPCRAWGWYGAHRVHLLDHPQVWWYLCWMFLHFSLPFVYFSCVAESKSGWVQSNDKLPAGTKVWGVLWGYMQIQALQNGLLYSCQICNEKMCVWKRSCMLWGCCFLNERW